MEHNASEGKRVLIVDDEAMIRHLLVTYLERKGWRSESAATGAVAIAALEREAASCVIVDVHLGTESGYDVMRVIAERWPETRIIAMTGSGLSLHELAREAGAVAFLEKPFNSLDEVIDVLE